MGSEFIHTVYGLMSTDFDCSELQHICVNEKGIQTGPFGSQLHQRDYIDSGTPIVTVEHLGDNRINRQNLPYVKPKDRDRLSKYLLEEGDIVFSRVGSVDRRALIRKEEDGWLFSGRCLRIRPDNKKINSEYLSWFFGLPTFKEYIRQIAVGATMPSLNTKILRHVKIYYPKDIGVQRAIAYILGTLDDKIELNRQMNQTLEAMAQAIFKSWFVDFDPVRAKAEGRDTGLPPEIAALFPSEFQDSELGPIPKGWKVGRIGDRAGKIQYGFTQSASNEKIGPHFLRITDIRGGDINWDDVPYCQISDEDMKKYRIMKSDIFIARTGASTGENVYIIEEQNAVFASYLIRVQYKEKSLSRVIGEFLRSSAYSNYIEGILGGSAQPNANAKQLTCAKFNFPPLEISEKFFNIIDSLDRKRAQNRLSSRFIARVRDTLLPKLISGEIRMPDAEKFIEGLP